MGINVIYRHHYSLQPLGPDDKARRTHIKACTQTPVDALHEYVWHDLVDRVDCPRCLKLPEMALKVLTNVNM